MTVEIVEHDSLWRSLHDARTAAHDDDAPGAVAHEIQQLVHQGKVTKIDSTMYGRSMIWVRASIELRF